MRLPALQEQGEKPIRSFYVYGGNPVASVCCQKGIMEDYCAQIYLRWSMSGFMTDTAMYADILLPAAFSVEQTDVYTAYGYCTFGTARKIIEPAGQSKSNWNTLACWLRPWDMRRHILRRQRKRCLRSFWPIPWRGYPVSQKRNGVY